MDPELTLKPSAKCKEQWDKQNAIDLFCGNGAICCPFSYICISEKMVNNLLNSFILASSVGHVTLKK